MSKVIVHIDLNAFFVRCEEIKNPSLVGKPIAIGNTGRKGIVSTSSYKAREYGVKSGMPMFQATKLCPKLIVINDDYRFYRAKSDEFKTFLLNYTDQIEMASCDECFMDFTEAIKGVSDVNAYFKALQKSLFDKTGLMCSIGVAPTKFLAKMGSDYKKPMGLTFIHKKDIETLLYPLKVDDIYGLGKKSAPKLHELGINTIGEFMNAIENKDSRIDKVFTNRAEDFYKCLTGNSSDIITIEKEDNKSIGHTYTLMNDTSDIEEILDRLEIIAHWVSERSIMHGLVGSTIQITIKETSDNGFKVHNKSLTINKLTNSYKEIFKVAKKLYEDNFIGIEIRMVGITLQKLIPIKEAKIQMSLFDYQEHEEENRTFLIIEDLNRKLTKPMLFRASELEKKDDHR